MLRMLISSTLPRSPVDCVTGAALPVNCATGAALPLGDRCSCVSFRFFDDVSKFGRILAGLVPIRGFFGDASTKILAGEATPLGEAALLDEATLLGEATILGEANSSWPAFRFFGDTVSLRRALSTLVALPTVFSSEAGWLSSSFGFGGMYVLDMRLRKQVAPAFLKAALVFWYPCSG